MRRGDGRLTQELDPQDQGPQDACGVFGVYAPGEEVAKLSYFGLYALQHRGQESAGIATSDGEKILVFKDMGLVSQVFDEATTNPHTAYGISKFALEMLALNLGRKYGIPVANMRYSIVHGPRNSFYNAYSGIARIFTLLERSATSSAWRTIIRAVSRPKYWSRERRLTTISPVPWVRNTRAVDDFLRPVP